MRSVYSILVAVITLLSLPVTAFPQADEDTIPLLDKVILHDAVEIPAGLPLGLREIPCNILSETPNDVTINFSKIKRLPQKLVIPKNDIKEIYRGDTSVVIYLEIKSKLGAIDEKLKSATTLGLPYKSANLAFYNDLLEKNIDPILQKFPNSPHLDEVKAFREKVIAEIDQLKLGKMRIGEQWLTESEYQVNKINFDCLHFIDKIRSQGAPFPPKLFLNLFEDLDNYKASSHYPKAAKALQDASALITPNSIEKMSGRDSLDDEKRAMREELTKRQLELATAEDELKKIINKRVDEVDSSWATAGTAQTGDGKKYNRTDARLPDQERILMPMAKYLDRRTANDLPFLQLAELDMKKATDYFKVVQDKTSEVLTMNREFSQLDRSFEAKQRELQTKIRNATRKMNSGSYARYSQASDTFEIFKASFKVFQQSPTTDINEINKLLLPLNQAKAAWPENVDILSTAFDVGFFLLDTSKKFIEQKNYKDATSFIQQAERIASELRISPDSPLATRNIAYRTEITSLKSGITGAIKSDQDSKIAAEKRLKEITTTIEGLNKSKDWAAVMEFKSEIESLDSQNRLKAAMDTAARNQTLSDSQYAEALRFAKGNNFDSAIESFRKAQDTWPKNPKAEDVKSSVISGYKKTFANKDYVNAIKWLDIANFLKTDETLLNVNEEIDKCTQLIDEAKKQKMILYSGIGAGALILLLIIVFIVKLVLAKKAAAPVAAPAPPTPQAQHSHHPHTK